MPFGLCGAPATFQRALTSVLSAELNKKCCVYLDDIIIFGRSIEEHDRNIAGFKLSQNKCTFLSMSVHFLGHIVSKEGVRTNPEKVAKIQNLPKLQTFKQLHCRVCKLL